MKAKKACLYLNEGKEGIVNLNEGKEVIINLNEGKESMFIFKWRQRRHFDLRNEVKLSEVSEIESNSNEGLL